MSTRGARGTRGIGLKLGGTAVVCCIHDREKRVVTTERDVATLGLEVGVIYDSKQHKIHLCACCQNLFVDVTDIPKYCTQCRGPNVHAQMGPLAPPRGVLH
jgi:hypothetical protein